MVRNMVQTDIGKTRKRYDVAIVGGGTAGLSAALLLGRARRTVAVLDAGGQRNLPAHESHSFFTRDGAPPRELVRIGREQLAAYPTVDLLGEEAIGASAAAGGFELTLATGGTLRARKLILASGVRDILPALPGVQELWGKGIFHCPYCHGHEVLDAPIGIVLAPNEEAIALAQLMKGWSADLVLFSNGRPIPAQVRDELDRHRVAVREERIVAFEPAGDALGAVVLEGGARVERRAALLRPPQKARTALAERLGCRLTADGLIEVGPELETSVPGVYAAGDCIRKLQQLVFAAADGAAAATSANRKLLAEDWERGT